MDQRIKTVLFLGLLTGLIMLMGGALGGSYGMTVALVFASVMNFVAYWFSDKIVLSMYRAKPVSEADAPELFNTVKSLTLKGSIPMPKVYIINTSSPNAFATGRNPKNAAVAVTRGILDLLNRHELEGVIAHELSHVKNRDILISSIAATLAGAIMMVANMTRWAMFFIPLGGRDSDENPGGLLAMLVMAIIAPIAAMLIQMAISRSREFLADRDGARICGSSSGLASALEKLAYASSRIPMQASPATSHLFIVNPLKGKSFLDLFSTHPPVEERIRRLRELRFYMN